MKHYTEIEITDIVLSGRRDASFEEHSAACAGCRELYEDIAEYHALLHQRQLALPGEVTGPSIEARPEFVGDAPRLSGNRSLARRVYDVVRRHPVAAGGTLLSSALLFAVLFLYLQTRSTAELSYYRINTQQGTIEVFDEGDDFLWSLPVAEANIWKESELQRGQHLGLIADFNGDGHNDLIVLNRVGADVNHTNFMLKVYNRHKRVIHALQSMADADVRFNGVQYNQTFYPIYLKCVTIAGRSHLFVLSNNGRSPSFIAHFDEQGSIVGRFWHFGQLGAIDFSDIDGNGAKELVAIGLNDVPFPGLTDGVTIVLDPAKVIGETESSASRGFGLPVSDAELYYVKFPRSDLDDSLRLQSTPREIKLGPAGLAIAVRSVKDEAYVLSFEYVFGTGMRVLDVKGDDGSARMHERYAGVGRISSQYGSTYFETQKRNVRYWDGSAWDYEARSITPVPLADK